MSSLNAKESRALTVAERRLLERFVTGPFRATILEALDRYLVVPMCDDGMGSVKIVGPETREFGETIGECSCRDSDGTPVSIAINVDQDGHLFEIDIWKVDFTPLIAFPKVEECR